MGLGSGNGAQGAGVAYTFTHAEGLYGGNSSDSRNHRQKRVTNAAKVDMPIAANMKKKTGKYTKKGPQAAKLEFRHDSKLRVGGRLVNKGDMKLLEEFVKAGYV